MCHSSPTISVFATGLAAGGTAFYLVHIYKFDKGRCLIPTRKDLFRWVMLVLLGIVVFGFLLFGILESYVKYKEGHLPIPEVGIIPTPYLLWSKEHSTIYRASVWCSVIALCALCSVHLEEILYWLYMLRACRNNGSAHWLRSIWYKFWLVGSVVTSGILTGCTLINSDFAEIEANLWMSASVVSFVLSLGSCYMAWRFPLFVAEARRLGANQEVLSRLLYVQVLGNLRTVFRVSYVFILFMLSIDGMTHNQKINNNRFALDALLIAAYFSIFAAETLTLWILLPRKSTQAAGRQVLSQQSANLLGGQPVGLAERMGVEAAQTASAWSILGDRLNLDRGQVTDFNPDNSMLSPSVKDLDDLPSFKGTSVKNSPRALTSPMGVRWTEGTRDPKPDVPFYHRGQRGLDDVELGQMNIPSVLKHFQGPIDFRTSPDPKTLKVLVTNETVRNQDQ